MSFIYCWVTNPKLSGYKQQPLVIFYKSKGCLGHSSDVGSSPLCLLCLAYASGVSRLARADDPLACWLVTHFFSTKQIFSSRLAWICPLGRKRERGRERKKERERERERERENKRVLFQASTCVVLDFTIG